MPLALAALVLAMGTGLLWTTTPALAQSPAVTLEVVPNEVDLPMRGGAQDVTVVLRNPTGDTLRDVQLAIGLEAGVSVTPAHFAAAELVPRGELAWVFKVQDAEQVPGRLRLRVDYMATPAIQAAGQQNQTLEQPPVPRVMLMSVDVKVRSVETADTLADVQVETTLTTLNEKRPGIVYITTTNKSSIPVCVGQADVSTDDVIIAGVLDQQRQAPRKLDQQWQDSCKLDQQRQDSPDSDQQRQDSPDVGQQRQGWRPLGPRGSMVDPITIQTADKVRPGKYLVLFTVPIKWIDAWGSQEGQILIKHEVEVSVFGESQILALMAIPTFFVLPGTIAMFTFLLVHKILRKPADREEEYKAPITQGTPDFWLIAVTISLVVSVVYPLVTTRLLGRGVDYLESYSYADIVHLWLGSVILTVCVFVLSLGLWNISGKGSRLLKRWVSEARLALKNREAMKRMITTVDEPLEVLQKLHLTGLNVRRPPVVTGEDAAQQPVEGFLLEPWPPDDGSKDEGEYWVGPPIRLRWNRGANATLKDDVQKQLNLNGPIRELVRLLFEARRQQLVSLTWVPRFNLQGPVRIKGPLKRPGPRVQPQGFIIEGD